MGQRKLFLFVLLATLLLAIAVLGFVDLQNVNPPSNALRLIGLDQTANDKLAARLRPQPGFQVNLFADGLGSPRLMAMTSTGDILVSVPRRGTIVKLGADRDGDGRADTVTTLLDGLSRPHGLDLVGNTLYIAEEGAVSQIAFDAETGETTGERKIILSGLPTDGGHTTRTLRMGTDNRLYLSVGSSCNVCIEDSPWRAAILRLEPDGSAPEIYASGLRNTVGFDWRPATGDLFGVDNGRDLLGDGYPPDELNQIIEGRFYGWPFFNGDNSPDPDFGDAEERSGLVPTPPDHGFAAHVAPLSIRFLRHQPDRSWNGAALVAHHGSWNRSSKIGYRIVSLRWRDDGGIDEQLFLDGFRDGEDVLGRPVDVIEAPDGTLYVSDDFAGAVWRVTPQD